MDYHIYYQSFLTVWITLFNTADSYTHRLILSVKLPVSTWPYTLTALCRRESKKEVGPQWKGRA